MSSMCSSRRTRKPSAILLVATVNASELDALLKAVRDGQVSPADARARLAGYATEDLGFATIDHAREARTGWPEVVFGAGKTPDQVAAIAELIAPRGHNVLITRTTPEAHRIVSARLPRAGPPESPRAMTLEVTPVAPARGTSSRAPSAPPPVCRKKTVEHVAKVLMVLIL